jgi:cation transport ATPase
MFYLINTRKYSLYVHVLFDACVGLLGASFICSITMAAQLPSWGISDARLVNPFLIVAGTAFGSGVISIVASTRLDIPRPSRVAILVAIFGSFLAFEFGLWRIFYDAAAVQCVQGGTLSCRNLMNASRTRREARDSINQRARLYLNSQCDSGVTWACDRTR